jgi:hypothetical protein
MEQEEQEQPLPRKRKRNAIATTIDINETSTPKRRNADLTRKIVYDRFYYSGLLDREVTTSEFDTLIEWNCTQKNHSDTPAIKPRLHGPFPMPCKHGIKGPLSSYFSAVNTYLHTSRSILLDVHSILAPIIALSPIPFLISVDHRLEFDHAIKTLKANPHHSVLAPRVICLVNTTCTAWTRLALKYNKMQDTIDVDLGQTV